jgi:hypothetical protein
MRMYPHNDYKQNYVFMLIFSILNHLHLVYLRKKKQVKKQNPHNTFVTIKWRKSKSKYYNSCSLRLFLGIIYHFFKKEIIQSNKLLYPQKAIEIR